MSITEIPAEFCNVSIVNSRSGHSVVRVTGALTLDAVVHLADVLDLLLNANRPIITVDLRRAALGHRAVVILRQARRQQHRHGRQLLLTGIDEDALDRT